MTGGAAVAAGALLAAAMVAAVPGPRPGRRRHARMLRPGGPGSGAAGRTARSLRRLLDRSSLPVAATVAAATVGLVAGGPIAALVAVVYGLLLSRGLRRRRTAAERSRARRDALDALSGLAADLRAGLPPVAAQDALGLLRSGSSGDRAPQPGRADDRVPALAGAAFRLAERTGAPLADLMERVEADARAADRATAAASAQAAGAQATAWLLAGLPVGGIALGYAIGVDPLYVLLRTPLGAACAIAALVFQIGGLAWAERLVRPPEVGR